MQTVNDWRRGETRRQDAQVNQIFHLSWTQKIMVGCDLQNVKLVVLYSLADQIRIETFA